MKLVEFKKVTGNCKTPLLEKARIDHAEDLIFWEGSRGALRAISQIESLAKYPKNIFVGLPGYQLNLFLQINMAFMQKHMMVDLQIQMT